MLLSTRAHQDYTWGVIKPTGAAVIGEQSRGSLYHVAHVAPSPGVTLRTLLFSFPVIHEQFIFGCRIYTLPL